MDWKRIGTGTLDDVAIYVDPPRDVLPINQDVTWVAHQTVSAYWKEGKGFGCVHNFGSRIFYTAAEFFGPQRPYVFEMKVTMIKEVFRNKLMRGCLACRRTKRYTPLEQWIPPVCVEEKP